MRTHACLRACVSVGVRSVRMRVKMGLCASYMLAWPVAWPRVAGSRSSEKLPRVLVRARMLHANVRPTRVHT